MQKWKLFFVISWPNKIVNEVVCLCGDWGTDLLWESSFYKDEHWMESFTERGWSFRRQEFGASSCGKRKYRSLMEDIHRTATKMLYSVLVPPGGWTVTDPHLTTFFFWLFIRRKVFSICLKGYCRHVFLVLPPWQPAQFKCEILFKVRRWDLSFTVTDFKWC